MAKIDNRLPRQGMMTVVQLVTVTFFALLALLMLNIAAVTNVKIQTQNAADAAARTATTILARGMNALCTTNHLIGEATAMLAVHEAVGGPRPGRVIGNTGSADAQLLDAYIELWSVINNPPRDPTAKWTAAVALAMPFAYHDVRRLVLAEATVLIAKRILKQALAEVYRQKAASLRRLDCVELARLNGREAAIQQEYAVLTDMRRRAATEPSQANRQLKERTLPELHRYARLLVEEIPGAAVAAARQVGRVNNVQIELYPARPELPVQVDPLAKASGLAPVLKEWYGPRKTRLFYPRPAGVPGTAINRRQIVKITQLCRATFPWVNYHRQPILSHLTATCPLSDAGKIYFDETAGATLRICDEMQREQDRGLFVLKRATLPDKGFENWTDDPAGLESEFSVICIAGRLQPSASEKNRTTGYFTKLLPTRHGATARSIVYSAKPQIPHEKRIDLNTLRIVPVRQPRTGWDTLQWKARSAGMPFELIGKGSLLLPEFPLVEVGWQAKLVPVSPGRIEQLTTGIVSIVGDTHALPEVKILSQFAPLATH